MFTLLDLPYAYNALEPFIDEQTMKIHHDKHHQAYVDNLNAALEGQTKWLNMKVEDILEDLNRLPEGMQTKVRNHGGGHANHSLFWQIMGPPNPPAGGEPTGEFMTAINNAFGSVMSLEEAMTKAAMGRFGSGWAWLVVSRGRLEVMDTSNQDSPLLDHKIPLLGIDVW